MGGRRVAVEYDAVSLAVWSVVSSLGLVAGAGSLVSSPVPGDGSWVLAAVVTVIGAAAAGYFVPRWFTRGPRLVIDAEGLHDRRSGSEVVVPWQCIERVRFTRGRGRRRIALTLTDGADARGEWPFWMRGWGFEGRDVLISDWLVRMSLEDIAEAIRSRLPERSVFEPEPTFGEAVDEVRDWWKDRRRPRS